ncbi:chromosomal replication initiator protein DnaA [Moraxella nasovis]|uniref:chromosomal replication initiator protein DnaA n=1 Tax=Moraxella nasovis TaxID=2904121 RepID=UPI001F6198BA|nr:chromosomal replication initiator protein DnaA [Moraxella nasovis]UNU74257.1 chromosomal replication initiator protein DnaA [Moraxella nasovis]
MNSCKLSDLVLAEPLRVFFLEYCGMMSLFDDTELDEPKVKKLEKLDKAVKPAGSMAFWQACTAEIQESVGNSEYSTWLASLNPKIVGDVLILQTINSFFVKHIKTHYLKELHRLVSKHAQGMFSDVQIAVFQDTQSNQKSVPAKRGKTVTQIAEGMQIEERFTFDAFVKGKSNATAYNVCHDLSKKMGQSDYTLYFIYGSSGLGKTHLMHAVAHRYQKAGLSYCYFTKDRFFEETVEALRGGEGKTDALIKRICKADLLIVDDVHLINNKKAPKVSQLLLTLFTEFTNGKKRLILASDRQPSQMEGFEDRFVSRFSSGVTVAIEPPDIEMRVQILEKKASLWQVDLPKECALFIAQNVPPDVRRLEGALNQVRASVIYSKEAITLPLVKHAIKDHIEARARAVNAENIREVVAEYYGVSVKDLMGKKRARNIARPRQMAMALIRDLTKDSFPEIGQAFGGRDHSTVMHACEKIKELCDEDPKVLKDYSSLKATLEFA